MHRRNLSSSAKPLAESALAPCDAKEQIIGLNLEDYH
jgi:hypothetical protein